MEKSLYSNLEDIFLKEFETLEEAEAYKVEEEAKEAIRRQCRQDCFDCKYGDNGTEDKNNGCLYEIGGTCVNYPRFDFDKEYNIVEANS